eukprot:362452-Chlamydomonas_euryale.AAC.3
MPAKPNAGHCKTLALFSCPINLSCSCTGKLGSACAQMRVRRSNLLASNELSCSSCSNAVTATDVHACMTGRHTYAKCGKMDTAQAASRSSEPFTSGAAIAANIELPD